MTNSTRYVWDMSTTEGKACIEELARDVCREVLEKIPGWFRIIDQITASMKKQTAELFEDRPVSYELAAMSIDRAGEILKEIWECQTNEAVDKYWDILPKALKQKMFEDAKEALRGLGVNVVEMRNEAGEPWVRVSGLEGFIDEDEIDRLVDEFEQEVPVLHTEH